MISPIVSILIPCHNAEQWIGAAIESGLQQTWTNKEIIVVDDGSTDHSVSVIQRYADQIHFEVGFRRGGNGTRNRLLELAKGDWLQYLDADDYLLPDKIAQQLETLKKFPTADLIFGPIILEHWQDDGVTQEILPIPEPHDPFLLLSAWRLPQTGSPLWRKQAIVDAGGWEPDQPCCQEHELYLRMLMSGKSFIFNKDSGAVYRQWSQTTLCNRDTILVNNKRLEILQRLEDHLRAEKHLTHDRLHSINETRFRIARSFWPDHRDLALGLMGQVHALEPDFMPSDETATARYRLAYKYLGFRVSELLGSVNRAFQPGASNASRNIGP